MPQAFNWAAYKKTPEEKAKYRAPTEAELRSMCWQCIANGANGLVLYSYFDLFKQPNGERAETRWAECCRVGAEIQAQIPVLLSVEGAGRTLVRAVETAEPVESTAEKPISTRAWVKEGKTYVLVVNGGETAQGVRMSLEDGYSKATNVLASTSGTPILEGTSVLRVNLAPLEPALVCLEPILK